MARDFKKQAKEARIIQPRAAIPQVDPGAVKHIEAVGPIQPQEKIVEEPAHAKASQPTKAAVPVQAEPPVTPADRPIYLTPVDSSEKGSSQAFAMLPSRHTQLKDLAYIENRKPWQIIEDALEEYVTKRYGKQHKRR